MQKNTSPAKATVWTKLAALKENDRVGFIVRGLEHAEELHRIRLAIVVEHQQPGAGYTPLQIKVNTAPTFWRIFQDAADSLRSYARFQFSQLRSPRQ